MSAILALYERLYETHGPQGWWPITSARESDGGALRERGYHPLDYTLPQQDLDRFEIAAGAILTQNTAWTNVEKAIQNLADAAALTPKAILKLGDEELATLVKPAGYYNQKAKKLKILAAFMQSIKRGKPSRDKLLELWGIGKETADSILLYAYHEPIFVVDTYSKRLLSSLNLVGEKASYDEIQRIFIEELPRDVVIYQEFHALIVAHGKELAGRKGRAS